MKRRQRSARAVMRKREVIEPRYDIEWKPIPYERSQAEMCRSISETCAGSTGV